MIVSGRTKIVNEIKSNKHNLVAIHGAPLAGKSTLAEFIAEELCAVLIRVDDFILKNPKGCYTDFIDKARLREVLGISLANNPYVVIEGMCLLDILEKIKFKPSFIVYAKNQYDNDWINYDLSEDQLNQKLEEVNSIMKFVPNSDGECLDKDNSIYHYKYKPVRCSDLIYVWQREA